MPRARPLLNYVNIIEVFLSFLETEIFTGK